MEDDKLIPLSYISQYCYCKRRAGLLMLEQQWSESADTAKGRNEHQHVHTLGTEAKGKVILLTEITVISHSLSLLGKCDAVEATESSNGFHFPFLDDKNYQLYPIEYKHGKLRNEAEYELQLCAQAMCLEEMYSCNITKGALFFISSHRRKEILFDDEKRNQVQKTAELLIQMLQTQKIPQAEASAKCIRCSLKPICMPDISSSAKSYMRKMIQEYRKDEKS